MARGIPPEGGSKTLWKPGQSGNPAGAKPRKFSFTAALRAAETPEALQRLAEEVWRCATYPKIEPALKAKAWDILAKKLDPKPHVDRTLSAEKRIQALTEEAHIALEEGVSEEAALAPLKVERMAAEALAAHRGNGSGAQAGVLLAFPGAVVDASSITTTASLPEKQEDAIVIEAEPTKEPTT